LNQPQGRLGGARRIVELDLGHVGPDPVVHLFDGRVGLQSAQGSDSGMYAKAVFPQLGFASRPAHISTPAADRSDWAASLANHSK
jgi:hypothetical protein